MHRMQGKGDSMNRKNMSALLGMTLLCLPQASFAAAGDANRYPPPLPRVEQSQVDRLQQEIPGKGKPAAGPKAEAQVEDQNLPAQQVGAAVTFDVKSFRLEAPELDLDKAELTKILEEGMGAKKSLSELNAMLNKLTLYARTHGYPAATAYLPAQESTDGVVLVKLIPGHIGAVKLENHSRLRDPVAKSFLHGLKIGDILRTKKLETALYTLSDASGTRAVGVLGPGKGFGETELTVRIEEGKGESTILYAENYGSTSTGRYRYGIQHSMYDLDGTGAKFKVGGLLSNHEMHNFYINYEMLVGHGGTTVGLGYSRMDYKLGGPQEIINLDANGTADTVSVFGSRPIYHESDRSLTVNYGVDYRHLTDNLGKYKGTADSKKHSVSAYVGVAGSNRSSGLVTEYTANVRSGHVSMDSDYAKFWDSKGGLVDGSFTKAEGSFRATQALGHRTDATLSLSGQLASRNLDGSEDFSLGGANAVRAYPAGEASGDTGYLGSLEVRYYTPMPGLVASIYYDMGHVNFYRDPRSGSGGATLKGYGFGLAYTRPNDWFARLDYARRIGDYKDMSKGAQAKGRMWFILGKLW